MPQQWDIFCRVIDNYGDIGVAWRLAKTLCHDHQKQVRLWCDDIRVLHALNPSTDINKDVQNVDSIEINRWHNHNQFQTCADVVIETFGCELPEPYLQRMSQHPPVWINLDYFSAEPWVADFHGMSSKQANGLDKYFFYPSILPKTGGLLREANLLAQKQLFFQQNVEQAWLKAQGFQTQNNSLKISLFGYENPALTALVNSWQQSEQPIEVFVPQGRIMASLEHALNSPLHPNQGYQSDKLTVHLLPFLPQADYDKLLWSCDINFVRGEESMVRAQWAGKPFIWHIYPTDDNAHWDKLTAFFRHYGQTLEPHTKSALLNFNRQWNQVENQTLDHQAWLNFYQKLTPLQRHADSWIDNLQNLGDLTSNLVKFVRSKV